MDPDKFAPRVDNTKTEKTGQRSSEYSLWHRSLGSEFFAVDIDYVEFRRGRGIVAFIAVSGQVEDEKHLMHSKPYIWERTKMEREILLQLSKKIGVPSFFVIHTKDLSLFHVHKLDENLDKFTKMDQPEYANFIRTL